MAPLLAMLIQALIPVAVDEVKQKLAEKNPQKYPVPAAVPASEAAVPALQSVVAGAVGSKTSWFAFALMVLGFLQQNTDLLANVVPADKLGYVLAGIGALTFFFRALTTTSLVEKGDTSPEVAPQSKQ